MKIYAPVKDANGVWASVRFVNGVGETDNPTLIKWFESHGYGIEKSIEIPNLVIEMSNDQIEVETDEDEMDEMMGYAERSPNFEDMTPNELRDWARANGLGGVIKNTRNKEKLLELIKQNRG
jgi:hypothetical protein